MKKLIALFLVCGCSGVAAVPEAGPSGPIAVDGATPASSRCSAEATVVEWHPEYDFDDEFVEVQPQGAMGARGCTFSVNWHCDEKDPSMIISCAPDGSQPLLGWCSWPNDGPSKAFGIFAAPLASCSCTDLEESIVETMQACGTES